MYRNGTVSGYTTDSDACLKEQHIICDGHRRWLESCTEIARAALMGIAELNEYGV